MTTTAHTEEHIDDVPLSSLPPMEKHMRLADPEQFMHESPEDWRPTPFTDQFLIRETDIARLSGGAVGAIALKAAPGATEKGVTWHWHDWGIQIAYVINGWALYEFEGIDEPFRVEKGCFLYQLPNNRHRELESSPDFEAIEITFPGEFTSTVLIKDPASGEFTKIEASA